MKKLLLICLSAALALFSNMSLFAKSIPEQEWKKVLQQEIRRANKEPFSVLGVRVGREVERVKAQTQAKDKMDLNVQKLTAKWGQTDGERFKKNFLEFFPAVQKAFEANPLFKGYVLAVLDDMGGLEQQDYEKLALFFKDQYSPSSSHLYKNEMRLFFPGFLWNGKKFEYLEMNIHFQNKTVIVFKKIHTF